MAELRLKPTKPGQRRYFNTLCCDGRLADGTPIAIGAENDIHGGVVVWVSGQAYLLPYGTVIKAIEDLRRG